MKEEIWKSLDFLGYPDYEVSNFGRVKSLNYKRSGKEKILKQCKNNSGYMLVGLSKNNKVNFFYVHRLVALAFIPNDNPIKKTQINHLDENKHNNNVSNLCWCTCEENINYGTHNERISKTKKGKPKSEEHKQKLSEARKGKGSKPILQYTLDGVFIRDWDSATTASKELKIFSTNITKCCKKKLKTCGGFIWRYKE